ncbi:hypothetical protein ACMYZ5_10020, partial [Bacteroides sp. KG68]
ALQKAVNSMLAEMYPYCDAGSTAKVKVLFGDVTEGFKSADIVYTLTSADYDAMGEEKGQPGKYDNFDSKMDVDTYLKAFCTGKYADLAVGKTVSITYKYYTGSVANLTKTYRKTSEGWEEVALEAFVADQSYTLSKEDYDSMGEEKGQPGKFDNFDANMDVDFYLSIFLKQKFPYTKAGATCEVTYKYYNKTTTNKTVLYKYDGNTWSAYDPYADTVTVSTKIAEMSYNGTDWTLARLLGGTKEITMVEADYKALIEWVTANKPAFLSTQSPSQEEYYFGASSKYNNINNRYDTWKNHYNVDGYLTGKSDSDIQTIMDERIAEGIVNILLPSWVDTPDSGISYVIVYTVYGGRGNGSYAMSFMYNEETKKFDKVAGPVVR